VMKRNLNACLGALTAPSWVVWLPYLWPMKADPWP
jgi:hypothetical protein